MYDSLQCGDFESRALISHDQFCKSAEIADWCDKFTQQIPGQSFSSMEKSVAKVNEQLCRKLCWYKHLRRMFKQREIDCVITKRNSKIYQERKRYLRFVNRLDS